MNIAGAIPADAEHFSLLPNIETLLATVGRVTIGYGQVSDFGDIQSVTAVAGCRSHESRDAMGHYKANRDVPQFDRFRQACCGYVHKAPLGIKGLAIRELDFELGSTRSAPMIIASSFDTSKI
jgi:hypothetical protein